MLLIEGKGWGEEYSQERVGEGRSVGKTPCEVGR